MSVASVTNKTLQLAELVISNEKFTGATGYVASSSSFSSSVDGTSLATESVSFSNAPANAQFSSIQFVSLTNLNTAAFTAIPTNAGVGAVDAEFITYLNYQYSNQATPPPTSNIKAFGNVSATTDGVLLVNYVDALAPSNGLAGYCNLELAITNTSSINITPTNIDVFLFVAP
jgi:hypothetical protein